MPETLVCIATYNERENLPQLVDEVFRVLPNANVLVIDDNSPDGTGNWCQEQAGQEERLHCIRRDGKLGLGTAVIAGMHFAIERDFTFFINMDADFSHPPRYLPELLNVIKANEEVDVVVASRYVKGGGIEGWPIGRRLMSRAVNAFSRRMLWLPSRDCSGSFRCYRVRALRQLDFDEVRSRGYSFFEEILWHLRRAGAQFRELPYVFVDRERGESKIDLGEAVSSVGRIGFLGVKNWLGR